MKNRSAIFLCLALSTYFLSSNVFAGNVTKIGQVLDLIVNYNNVGVPDSPQYHMFTVDADLSSNCPTWDFGNGNGPRTVFMIDDRKPKIYALLLAAKMAGKPIKVFGNDDTQFYLNGYCQASQVTLY